LCVYRQPSANDTTLIDSLTRFRLANGQILSLLLVILMFLKVIG